MYIFINYLIPNGNYFQNTIIVNVVMSPHTQVGYIYINVVVNKSSVDYGFMFY